MPTVELFPKYFVDTGHSNQLFTARGIVLQYALYVNFNITKLWSFRSFLLVFQALFILLYMSKLHRWLVGYDGIKNVIFSMQNWRQELLCCIGNPRQVFGEKLT